MFKNILIFASYLDQFKNDLEVLDFNPGRIMEMLPHMGIGMLVIFVIIGIIILTTVAIQKFSGKK